jgi:Uma2 family endonuclease
MRRDMPLPPISAAPSSPRRLTYADYCALPEDGRRYELRDGRLALMSAPRFKHQHVVGELHAALRSFSRSTFGGHCVVAPFDVVLGDHDVVQPDVLWIAPADLRRLKNEGVFGPPTLVVEVLSPSTAADDRGDKRALYAHSGVPFLWIVDPETRVVEAFRLCDGVYVPSGRAEGEATAALPPFDDAPLSLADLWWSPPQD